MKLPPLREGRILRRYKRFLGDVELPDGTRVTVHVPNTGRMSGCWAPGAPVQISRATHPKRKLAWTLERVHMGAGWVGVNTARPNEVIAEGIRTDALPSLRGCTRIRREVVYRDAENGGRLDLELSGGAGPDVLIEVKNVTLLMEDAVRFPDAVSTRGQKHLALLKSARRAGYRAVLLFAVNRPEGRRFQPAWSIDPTYGRLLVQAARAGVEILAVRIRHTADGMAIGEPLPVDLRTPDQYPSDARSRGSG